MTNISLPTEAQRKHLISFDGLRDKYGVTVSRDTLRIYCREGMFPMPIKLGNRRIFWRTKDIERFINQQKPQPRKPKRRRT